MAALKVSASGVGLVAQFPAPLRGSSVAALKVSASGVGLVAQFPAPPEGGSSVAALKVSASGVGLVAQFPAPLRGVLCGGVEGEREWSGPGRAVPRAPEGVSWVASSVRVGDGRAVPRAAEGVCLAVFQAEARRGWLAWVVDLVSS
ncbi:hypothetical protein GCM10020295_56250 [Streptomyces cinereospinus]